MLTAWFSYANDNHIAKIERAYALGDTTKIRKDTLLNDSDDVKTRSYEISLVAASDQSRYGLSNGKTKLPYLEPAFTYTAKSGFYIETSDQFLLIKPNGGFDAFGLNPGWDIDLTDNTTLNFNYQYYHFKTSTPDAVRGSLNSDIESYIEQDVGDFVGKLTIDYDIYSVLKNEPRTPGDIIFSPSISYDFVKHFGKKSEILIIPQVDFDFGTRNFYTQYSNNLIADSTAQDSRIRRFRTGNSNSSFGTLDYNIMLSIEYKIGRFSIELAITNSRPLYNPSNPPNPPVTYGSTTLAYTIESKK
jgi:hypothetical protein